MFKRGKGTKNNLYICSCSYGSTLELGAELPVCPLLANDGDNNQPKPPFFPKVLLLAGVLCGWTDRRTPRHPSSLCPGRRTGWAPSSPGSPPPSPVPCCFGVVAAAARCARQHLARGGGCGGVSHQGCLTLRQFPREKGPKWSKPGEGARGLHGCSSALLQPGLPFSG